MMKRKPWIEEWWWKMERKFRPRSEVCGKKRENGEEEDEDEMESEGMSKVKWEMSFYVY